MIELLDPSTQTVLGSVSSLNVTFTNSAAGGGTTPPPPTITADLLWQNTNTGQASIWDMDGSTWSAAGR